MQITSNSLEFSSFLICIPVSPLADYECLLMDFFFQARSQVAYTTLGLSSNINNVHLTVNALKNYIWVVISRNILLLLGGNFPFLSWKAVFLLYIFQYILLLFLISKLQQYLPVRNAAFWLLIGQKGKLLRQQLEPLMCLACGGDNQHCQAAISNSRWTTGSMWHVAPMESMGPKTPQ